LQVIVIIFVLDFAVISSPVSSKRYKAIQGGDSRRDLYTRYTLHDILRCHGGLWLAYILWSAKKGVLDD
jgi:hypothetical protein